MNVSGEIFSEEILEIMSVKDFTSLITTPLVLEIAFLYASTACFKEDSSSPSASAVLIIAAVFVKYSFTYLD